MHPDRSRLVGHEEQARFLHVSEFSISAAGFHHNSAG